MSQPMLFTDAFGKLLKSVGFKKKSDTWHLKNEEITHVVNLQKSSYGKQYYINIAMWLNTMGENNSPKDHLCHIRCRWENLIPLDYLRMAALLDLENLEYTDQQRASEINRLFREYVIPFFDKTQSQENIKELLRTGQWPMRCALTAVGKNILGTASEPR